MEPDGIFDDVREAIDATPRFVAGIALGALVTLVALKALGFRFAVGANIGK